MRQKLSNVSGWRAQFGASYNNCYTTQSHGTHSYDMGIGQVYHIVWTSSPSHHSFVYIKNILFCINREVSSGKKRNPGYTFGDCQCGYDKAGAARAAAYFFPNIFNLQRIISMRKHRTFQVIKQFFPSMVLCILNIINIYYAISTRYIYYVPNMYTF